MKEYTIIEEQEVKKLLSIPTALAVIEKCLIEKSKVSFISLPKINIKSQNGTLRITPGESLEEFNVVGFRLYDVIRKDFKDQPQPIIIYDNESGKLKGIVISTLVGAYRTAAINTVMQKHLNSGKVNSFGVVGTGYQAKIHTLMYAYAFQPRRIYVYGRTDENLNLFVNEISEELGSNTEVIKCKNIEELSKLEVLILATRSTTNLIKKEVFTGRKIVTTIGPKTRGKSEVSNKYAESCDLIITDSIEQVKEYGNQFFIKDLSVIKDFSDVLNFKELNKKHKRVLLCSVGMGGTEVALANELLLMKQS